MAVIEEEYQICRAIVFQYDQFRVWFSACVEVMCTKRILWGSDSNPNQLVGLGQGLTCQNT